MMTIVMMMMIMKMSPYDVDVEHCNGNCVDDDDDENVTMKKAERLRRSLLPALSITTAAKKVATI